MSAEDYTSRFRLRRCQRTSIGIDVPRIEWRPEDADCVLELCSTSDDVALRDTEVFYFRSRGWSNEGAARAAGQRYSAALLQSFARLRIRVDAGTRGPLPGGFTQAMIDEFREEHGVRVINDACGLMVYESDPQPVFLPTLAPGDRGDRIKKPCVIA